MNTKKQHGLMSVLLLCIYSVLSSDKGVVALMGDMTLSPRRTSSSLRALLATLPPSFTMSLLSEKPFGLLALDRAVVETSAN